MAGRRRTQALPAAVAEMLEISGTFPRPKSRCASRPERAESPRRPADERQHLEALPAHVVGRFPDAEYGIQHELHGLVRAPTIRSVPETDSPKLSRASRRTRSTPSSSATLNAMAASVRLSVSRRFQALRAARKTRCLMPSVLNASTRLSPSEIDLAREGGESRRSWLTNSSVASAARHSSKQKSRNAIAGRRPEPRSAHRQR